VFFPIQASSISIPQIKGVVTPCTPSGNDVTNWQHRFIPLEGLVAQVNIVVSKNNSPPPPLVEPTQNAREPPNVSCMISNIQPCDIDKAFESTTLAIVNIIELGLGFPWKHGGNFLA